jgi:hypothetical protein
MLNQHVKTKNELNLINWNELNYYYYYYYYYYCIFYGFSRIQLKKLKYVVDSGILWKLEVALGQQKSAQAWTTTIVPTS